MVDVDAVVFGALAVVPVGVVELPPEGDDAVAAGVVCAVGSLGVIERVMAWTLWLVHNTSFPLAIHASIVETYVYRKTNEPVKRPREHEVIVGRQLAQTGGELALVDQPTGLVDDCEGEDGPERGVQR